MRLVLLALLVAGLCSQQSGGSTSSAARLEGTPLAPASGLLEAQVAMPAGFPPDVPIYPRARLIAEASFPAAGEVVWSMEWETPDSLTKVTAYYQKEFNQGDWTLTLNGSNTVATFSASVVRKSNSRFRGTLAGDSSSGVTKILLSLVSAG